MVSLIFDLYGLWHFITSMIVCDAHTAVILPRIILCVVVYQLCGVIQQTEARNVHDLRIFAIFHIDHLVCMANRDSDRIVLNKDY